MKEFKHFGVYGIIIKDNKIALVKKHGGPYDGKLDLPGGSFEFGERPEEALKRELLEEIGIEMIDCELVDADSVKFNWTYNDEILGWHHVGIFYKIIKFNNDIKTSVELDEKNNDSLGAEFYEIDKLKKEDLSEIAFLALKKMKVI